MHYLRQGQGGVVVAMLFLYVIKIAFLDDILEINRAKLMAVTAIVSNIL